MLAENFRSNVKSIRKQQGLTQQKLADLAGVSQFTISLLEGESSNPTVETIEAIAEALKINPLTLLMNQAPVARKKTARAS